MSNLVNCQNISKRFGALPLFNDITVGVSEGERVGIIGPNGSGKSTLLKTLAGIEAADSGTVSLRRGVKVAYVGQVNDFPPNATVESFAGDAVRKDGFNPEDLHGEIAVALAMGGFEDFSKPVQSLSGGWKKRLAIVSELLRNPDLLLLDEPTNHLDFAGVRWLEETLTRGSFATVAVSHDRYFLDTVATRIIEVNRVFPGGLLGGDGGYAEFLAKKAAYLEAEQQYQKSLANRVRREEEWLRRGPKARATKSSARIQEAHRLQDELAEGQARRIAARTQIDFSASGRKTKKLLTLEGVSKAMNQRTLFKNLSFVLSPGVRMGLLGPNGSGKTTLLKILSGEINSDVGKVERADRLRVVYFDQHREQLNQNISLRRALAPDGDGVIYRDRSIHVASWAINFAFRAEQLDVQVGRLSGGEQARVLIARMMLQPADLLLLDEPTNDLDIQTLEVLEESLTEFPGAVVLVTHDRYMLDRVSTVLLGLDGNGSTDVFADYSQWEATQREGGGGEVRGADTRASARGQESRSSGKVSSKKLSFNEQREWDQMEGAIEAAESDLAACQEKINDPANAASSIKLQEASNALHKAQATIDRLYARWAELEARRSP